MAEFAGGALIAQGLMAATRAMTGLASEALTAYAGFERLGASLQAMSAQEGVASGAFANMQDAMAGSVGTAQELMDWIERLAVQSPFGVQDVASAYRQGKAYGFTSDETQRLTEATMDFVAATGQEGWVIKRVALALGQMRARGKVMGGELNQLSEAGINVREILSEAFGVSTQELMDMVEKGLVPADRAIEAIIGNMETNWEGAAAAQANTFSGLLASLSDLKSFALRDLFGGVFRAVQPYLTGLVNMLTDPSIRNALKAVGEQAGTYLTAGLEKVKQAATSVMAIWHTLAAVMTQGEFLSDWMADIPEPLQGVVGFFAQLLSTLSPVFDLIDTTGRIAATILGDFASGLAAGAKAVWDWAAADTGPIQTFLSWLDTNLTPIAAAVLEFALNLEQAYLAVSKTQGGDIYGAVSAYLTLPEGWQQKVDQVNGFIADVKSIGSNMANAVAFFTGMQTGDMLKALTAFQALPKSWQATVDTINTEAVTPVVDAIQAFVGGVESLATVPAFILKFQQGDIAGALRVWESVPDSLKPITEALNTFVGAVGGFGALAVQKIDSVFGRGGEYEEAAVTNAKRQAGVGANLAAAFQSMFAAPEWENVKAAGQAVIGSIAASLEEAFGAPAWANVTAGVNTVKATFEGLQTIQWADIQAGLGWVSLGILAVQQEIDKFVNGFDMQAAATQIGDTINTVLGHLTTLFDSVSAVRTEAWGAIASSISTVFASLVNLASLSIEGIDTSKITNLVTTFTSGLASLAAVTFDEEKLGAIGTALGDLVGMIATKLQEAVEQPGFGEDIAKAVLKATGAFAQGAIALVSGFAKALSNVNWGQFSDSIDKFVQDFNKTIADALVAAVTQYPWQDLGVAIFDAIKASVLAAVQNPRQAAESMQGVTEALIRRTPMVGPILGKGIDIGKWIGEQLAGGGAAWPEDVAQPALRGLGKEIGDVAAESVSATSALDSWWSNLQIGLDAMLRFGKPVIGVADVSDQAQMSLAEMLASMDSFDRAMITAAKNYTSYQDVMQKPLVDPLTAQQQVAGFETTVRGLFTSIETQLQRLYLPMVTAGAPVAAAAPAPVIEAKQIDIPPIEPPNWEKFIPKLQWPSIVSFSWKQFISALKWDIPPLQWSAFIPRLAWPAIPGVNWREFIPKFSWPSVPDINWDRFIPRLNWSGVGNVPASTGTFGSSAFQHGTRYFRGGLALVGEAGRELVAMPRGSRVYSNKETEAMLGGGQVIRVSMGPVYINSELDIDAISYQVAKKIQSRMR